MSGVPASSRPCARERHGACLLAGRVAGTNQVGPASNSAHRVIPGGKTHVDQPSELKGEQKWEEVLALPIKCKVATQPDSPHLFFDQAHLQRGFYLNAGGEDQENVLGVPKKLLLVRLRRCLRLKLARRFCKTADTRLLGTSGRAARSRCVVRIWLCWAGSSLRSRCASS